MDDSVIEERKRLHTSLASEVEKRLVANADNFDKAILTYSSAGLALSLGFLKDFVPLENADYSWSLILAWGLFVAAIVSTVLSYLLSQLAQHRQLAISERYNIELIDDAILEKNLPAKMTEFASYFAGLCFVCALISNTTFVATNLDKGAKNVENSQRDRTRRSPGPDDSANPSYPSPSRRTGPGDSEGSGSRKQFTAPATSASASASSKKRLNSVREI